MTTKRNFVQEGGGLKGAGVEGGWKLEMWGGRPLEGDVMSDEDRTSY